MVARRLVLSAGIAGAVIAVLALEAESSAQSEAPATPAPAAAPAPAPLVVFYAPRQAPESVTGARATLASLARRRGTALLDLSPEPPPAPAAGQHLRLGIEAYQGFDYDRAQIEIQAVLDEAGRTGGAGLSASELADAHIHAALVAGERGDPTAAWEHFVQAALLDPSRRLDPVRYPPRVVEGFERALASVAAAAPAALRVDVDPACEVVLDGRPVHARDAVQVARGQHYLRVRCAGHAAYGGRVLVAEDSVTVRPALAPEAPPATGELRALAEQRGALSMLVAVAAASPGVAPTLTLALVDVATGKERGRVLASLAPDTPARRAELARAAETLIDEVTAPRASRTIGRTPARTPWYRRPWVWGAGGAAVGAAVGAALLWPFVADRGGSDGFDVHLGGDLPP